MQKDFALMSKLLACYLAAIVHDYEHRGVNNDFLIKTSDPLALLYNDVSPMENHHVASAFLLMSEDKYAFLPKTSKRVGAFVPTFLCLYMCACSVLCLKHSAPLPFPS